ncbi:MAG TPA: M28 family peptidase, partial [Candidatus Bathyarchaeia archaeon]|nr:M28 family peptidase [Candidatus Bathyarchaeia archaeon]
ADRDVYASREARVARATGEVFAGSETKDNMRVLCDSIGGRVSGSEGARMALDFAEGLLKKYGLAGVHRETYELQGWFRGPFTCEVVSPRRFAVHALALGNTPSTPPGGIEAEVVDASHGNPVELDRLGGALKGRYALVVDGVMPGGRWMHRSEVMREVATRGAAGLLYETSEPGQLPMTGTCWMNGTSPIPGAGISKEDGEWIRRALSRGERVAVRVEMTNKTGAVSSQNLVAEIPGSLPEFVIVGAHLDSWDVAQGAVDNGTGAIVLIEAARALAKSGMRPRAAIRFVLFTGEEPGLCGSNAYAASHEAELPRCRGMINCDMVGTPLGIRVMGHEEARSFFEELAKSLAAFELTAPLSFKAGIYGDQQAFLIRGVPVVVPVTHLEDESARYYHTAADTYDKVELKSLPPCAAFVGVLALELAWPERRPIEALDDAGVKKLVRDNDLEGVLGIWGDYPRHH